MIFLAIFSLGLISASSIAFRDDSKGYLFVRNAVLQLFTPLVTFADSSCEFITEIIDEIKLVFIAKNENSALREKNALLEKYYVKYEILEKENADLKEKLSYISSQNIKYKTAKIIGNIINESQKELFIYIASDASIVENSLVFNETGVIGRVISINNHYAKILLINDIKSNIPVRSVNSGIKMILSGTGNDDMIIKFLAEEKPIEIGDLIVTSGTENLIPDNIPVGRVVGFDGKYYQVSPFNNLANINIAYIYNE